jgi:hypothetical protein
MMLGLDGAAWEEIAAPAAIPQPFRRSLRRIIEALSQLGDSARGSVA